MRLRTRGIRWDVWKLVNIPAETCLKDSRGRQTWAGRNRTNHGGGSKHAPGAADEERNHPGEAQRWKKDRRISWSDRERVGRCTTRGGGTQAQAKTGFAASSHLQGRTHTLQQNTQSKPEPPSLVLLYHHRVLSFFSPFLSSGSQDSSCRPAIPSAPSKLAATTRRTFFLPTLATTRKKTRRLSPFRNVLASHRSASIHRLPVPRQLPQPATSSPGRHHRLRFYSPSPV